MADHVIARKFTELPWHDSKLLAVSVQRAGSEDNVILNLLLWNDSHTAHITARLKFLNAVGIRADIDLGNKRLCSDDIASARCLVTSEWLDEIRAGLPLPYRPESLFHFSIYLCPPGGELDIVAESFHLALDHESSAYNPEE